jgi:hypothetical protein
MSDSMTGEEPDLSVVQGTFGRSELNPSIFEDRSCRTFSLRIKVLLTKSLLTFEFILVPRCTSIDVTHVL